MLEKRLLASTSALHSLFFPQATLSFCPQYAENKFLKKIGLKVCQFIISLLGPSPKPSVERGRASCPSRGNFLPTTQKEYGQSCFWKKRVFWNHFCSKSMHNTWRIIVIHKVGTKGTQMVKSGKPDSQFFREQKRRGKGKKRGKSTYQKQGHCSAQYEASNHVRAVVPILRDPVEACQESCAESSEAQHWLGQSTALRLDCACNIHLE